MVNVFLDFLLEIWAYQFPKALIGNLIIYIVFLFINRNALIDFGWGFNQMVMIISFPIQYPEILNWKTWIVLFLLVIWGLRLSLFIWITRVIVKYSDTRYNELAKQSSKTKQNLFYLFQFIFQSILVMFPFSVVYWALYSDYNVITWNFYWGLVISIISLILEIIADIQLETYKKKKKNKSKKNNSDDLNLNNDNDQKIIENNSNGLFREGLWKKSRHPNLFFEWCFWVGIMFIGFNSYISLIGIIGPLSLFLIMYFVTIPVTERSMKARRKNWDEIIKGTNKFLPFF